MQFLCIEIAFLLAWPLFCGTLKGLSNVKDSEVILREGREKRGDSAVGGGAALCMSSAVDPSTELASPVRQLHLGKLQVSKGWIKWFTWGQDCNVLPLRDAQPRGLGLLCCSSSAPDSQPRGWGALLLPTQRRFISRLNQLGSINWNFCDKFISTTTWLSHRAMWMICPVFLLLPNIDSCCFFSQMHLLPFIFIRAFLERECTTDYIAFKELWSDQHDCCQMHGIKMETIKWPFKNIFSSYILKPRPQEDFWVMPLFSVCLGQDETVSKQKY